MSLADAVQALAIEAFAARPAGVSAAAWLSNPTGLPAQRVAAQLVQHAAALEGLSAHAGLDFALGDLLARLRAAVRRYGEEGQQGGVAAEVEEEVEVTREISREQLEAEKKRQAVHVSDEEEDAPLSKCVKTERERVKTEPAAEKLLPATPPTPSVKPGPKPSAAKAPVAAATTTKTVVPPPHPTYRKEDYDASSTSREAAPTAAHPAPAAAAGCTLLLNGRGSKHPKIFVAKKNACLKNQQELFSRFGKGEVAVEHAMSCLRPGGPLRRYWKATQDDLHAHIDTLYTFVEQLRKRVLEGTFDGTPGYLCEAPETYQFYYGGGFDGDCQCG